MLKNLPLSRPDGPSCNLPLPIDNEQPYSTFKLWPPKLSTLQDTRYFSNLHSPTPSIHTPSPSPFPSPRLASSRQLPFQRCSMPASSATQKTVRLTGRLASATASLGKPQGRGRGKEIPALSRLRRIFGGRESQAGRQRCGASGDLDLGGGTANGEMVVRGDEDVLVHAGLRDRAVGRCWWRWIWRH